MKTQLKIMFALLMVAAGTMAFAQTPSNSGTTIKNLDSVRFQLNRFDIPLTDLPYTECNRSGIAPIVIPHPGGLKPHDPPSDVIPNDSGLFKKPDGDVNIYWIHGLNGTVESLFIPAYCTMNGTMDGTFKPRRANSYWGNMQIVNSTLYNETYGITVGAYTVSDYFKNTANVPTRRTPNDYIIAHSQGGIIAREWLRNMDEKDYFRYPDIAYGLVTFGTPHEGAAILNNTRPDLNGYKLTEFMNTACQSLANVTATEIESDIRKNFWVSMVLSERVSKSMKDKLINGACSFLSETILPFALDDYHKRTTEDYYVGSPFLHNTGPVSGTPSPTNDIHPAGLSDYTLKVPVVQFYGEEEQPIMWRFFSSTLKLETATLSNTQIQFGYDSDDQIQTKVNEMISDFEAKYGTASNHYNYWSNKRCIFPTIFGGGIGYYLCNKERKESAQANKNLMEAYSDAIVWLKNANEYYLSSIVGAKTITPVKYCSITTAMNCDTFIFSGTVGGTTIRRSVSLNTVENLAPSSGCVNGRTITGISNTSIPGRTITCRKIEDISTVYRNTYTYKANDGVVLAESAAAQVKTTPGFSHFYVVMPKTNHDQMKNCSETKAQLNLLYNGTYGSLFRVDPK